MRGSMCCAELPRSGMAQAHGRVPTMRRGCRAPGPWVGASGQRRRAVSVSGTDNGGRERWGGVPGRTCMSRRGRAKIAHCAGLPGHQGPRPNHHRPSAGLLCHTVTPCHRAGRLHSGGLSRPGAPMTLFIVVATLTAPRHKQEAPIQRHIAENHQSQPSTHKLTPGHHPRACRCLHLPGFTPATHLPMAEGAAAEGPPAG